MWRDYPVKNEDLEPLAELIPDYCLPGLKSGDLSCSVVLNEDDGENPVVGVIIYRIAGEDMEIEWVAPTQSYDLPEQGADMVALLAVRARLAGGLHGLFARFREGDQMADYFPETEYTLTRESDRIYRFRLSDAESLNKQNKNKRLENCIPLKQADHALQNSLLSGTDEHDAAIPIPRPVRWEAYDQEISAFYREADGRANGLILVDKEGDELVIRLLYSPDSVAAITLIEHAFRAATEKYSAEQEVACPVLNGVSEALVKKIVKDPKCGEVIRAQMVFPPDAELGPV